MNNHHFILIVVFHTNILHSDPLTQNFRKIPMDLRISPFIIKILLDSNPLKPRILLRRLAVLSSKFLSWHCQRMAPLEWKASGPGLSGNWL